MIKNRILALVCSFVMIAGQMVFGQTDTKGASLDSLKSPLIISLSGSWKFALDSSNTGVISKWFNKPLDDNILLPGTTDEARKGTKNQKSSIGTLTRVYSYYGAAWYQREVEIPQSWKGKHITFLMEKTKTSTVWIDDKEIGSDQSLTTAHVYDLSRVLSPGKHTLTVRINNQEKPPVGDPHQISDQTQTNWNGILGEIQLKATDHVWMDDIQIYPDLKSHSVQLKIRLGSMSRFPERGKFTVFASTWNTKKPQTLEPASFISSIDSGGLATITYDVGKDMQLWDEFSPSLYKFNIRFEGSVGKKSYRDQKELSTGLKEFKTKGTHFIINGKTTFLRGKHDACVFPLTGYAPMSVDEWVRVLRIAKSPARMTLKLQVNEFSNSYPIWIYPVLPEVNTKGVTVTRVLDKAAKKSLDRGKSVLLILDSASIVKSIPGAFQTDFWCYPMFKKYSPPGTLGILTNPTHGVFASFPTESHSNWQWWRMLKNNPVMVLDSLPKQFRPIIQVVDNFERNQKLGLLFEASVGKGRLVVSSIDLTKNSPEIRSLFSSIVNYMNSTREQPKDTLDNSALEKIVRSSFAKIQSSGLTQSLNSNTKN